MAEPKPETQPPGRDTKAAIRDAAIRLIVAHGYELTSLRQIADEVGISKASLYYHYPSKQDLLLAVARPVFDEFVSIAARVADLEYTPHNVADVFTDFVAGMLTHREVGMMVMRDPSIANVITENSYDVHGLTLKLIEWLAGPNPTVETRLRAGAAMNVLSMALTPDYYASGAGDDEVASLITRLSLSVLMGE